jgi:hypothetical protein
MVTISVSIGELVDKIIILRIKRARFTEPSALQHVRRELQLLEHILGGIEIAPLDGLIAELATINEQLWEVLDRLEDREAEQDFGETFIALARSVHILNRKRSDLKRQINFLTDSGIVEEKRYGRKPS